jgi:altered-inheritance-of-mitochondria protein 13
VQSELKRLQERAAKDYEELTSHLSQDPPASDKNEEKSAGDTLRDLGRQSVQNDVAELRKKLEQRKKVVELDEAVEKAKGDVVTCLRVNDRRPLDCWREVERFREEVRRLEGGWVEKITR